MLLGVLGTLVARGEDGAVAELGGPARRLLLAALVARGGRPVASRTLIEDLWGAAPPASAVKTLQSHIVRLRRDLAVVAGEDEVIVTCAGSYRVAVERHVVDVGCFERDLRRGTEMLAAGEAERALRHLDAALGWWRGDAYADFPDAEFTISERLRLTELRTLAYERRIDAALLGGRGASLVSEIEARIASDPYRERFWEQLMVALYRADRAADALKAYRRARTRFADELGIEPGPELDRLQQRVLAQDESLRAGTSVADVTAAPADPMTSDAVAVSPYLGLARYEATDSALFVGREETVARLLARLATTNPLVVAGDSGVGKSSLIRAGLLTALRADRLPGSARWTCEVIRPEQLTDTARARVDVVVVDQAEDLFAVNASTPEAVDAGISRLVEDGVRVVLVVRADSYGRLAELPRLGALIGPATELVQPLSEGDLARVIAEPARRVGLDVSPELIARMLDDVRGQSGVLPLVSTALLRTWQKRRGATLTVTAYEAGGGVQGALEATAEDAYFALDDAQRAAARRLLLRMVTRRGTNWARRPLPIGEVETLVSQTTLDVLIEGRLVTVSADQAELVHDALLEHWPRLRDWLSERSAIADLVETVDTTARVWEAGGRQVSDLIRGHRLSSALEWAADNPDDVTELEQDFLAASDEAARAELLAARAQARREARGRRRLRYLVALLAVATLAATAGVVLALRSRSDEQRAALSADARRLAALSLTAPDLRTALLLAVAAQRLDPSDDTRGALLSALQRTGTALWHADMPGRAQFVAVDAAGRSLWTVDQSRTVYRYDIARRAIATHFAAGGSQVAAVSPDGRQLVVVGKRGYFDNPGASRAVVLDATNGEGARVLPVRAVGDGSVPVPAVFTSDGRWLAVAVSGPASDPGATPPSRMVAIFDAGNLAARPRLVRLDAGLRQLAAGRSTVATVSATGTVQVLDPSRLATVSQGRRPELADTPSGPVQYSFALSPDASRLAFTEPDDPSQAFVVPAGAPATVPRRLVRLDAPVAAMTFSPTGRLVAASARNGEVDVFRADDGSVVARPVGAAPGQATYLAWAGSGTRDGTLYAAGQNGQVLALDTGTGPRLVTDHGAPLPTPDGVWIDSRHLAALEPARDHGATLPMQIVDLGTGNARTVDLPIDPSSTIQEVSLDARADRGLVVTQDQRAVMHSTLYDLTTGRVIGRFVETGVPSVHNTDVGVIAPDARTAAYAIAPHRMAVVELPSGRRLRTFDIHFTGPDADRHWVAPLQFAPDGRVLVMGFDVLNTQPAAGPENQLVGIVDTKAGRLDGQVGGFGEVGFPTAYGWSKDGSLLAIGSAAGVARVVDARNLEPVSPPAQAAVGIVTSVAFSPDGSTLVTGGSDGRLTFWDSHTLQPIGQSIIASRADSWWAVFRADGNLAGYAPTAADGTEQWFTMPARPDEWIAIACRFAGGGLTGAEWTRYVGAGHSYRRLC